MAIMNNKSTGIENVKSNTTNILVAIIDENDKFNARNIFENNLKEYFLKIESKKQKFQYRRIDVLA